MRAAHPLRATHAMLRCRHKRCRARLGLLPVSKGGRVLECGDVYFTATTVVICRLCHTPHVWTPARTEDGVTAQGEVGERS